MLKYEDVHYRLIEADVSLRRVYRSVHLSMSSISKL